MDVRAAVAHKAGEPLSIETVQLEGPKEGEVLVEIKATGICHTDEFTLSGADPEGIFPAILGHEGAGVVAEVRQGRDLPQARRPRDPALYPRMPASATTAPQPQDQPLPGDPLETQGQGLMPDGTSRFSLDGEKVFHYMGTSTFANHTVRAGDRAGQGARGRAVRQDLLHRLRRHHRASAP